MVGSEMKKQIKKIKYLRKKEWSMGNGQCPECCGVPESWHGHPCYMIPEKIGHELSCHLASSLKELGEKPLMKGDFKSNVEFEHYVTDDGIHATRKKVKK